MYIKCFKIIILIIITGHDLFFTIKYGMSGNIFYQFLICGIFGLINLMLAGTNLNVC